ncbi:PAAR domain-containing protein [Sandaracinus amylolyticus]|uniref:Uncharacterized protein n=1 Tax=Sandaracinus amylolyticus TaxID=927083 RepID=A0A0F6SGK0_9BACT|nr:PAAR domain-containing protein [Sandaracinus amylolyticus]AKF08829.1 hypothetical protein DB32_005978 [Sandaracinus amylolyticus]
MTIINDIGWARIEGWMSGDEAPAEGDRVRSPGEDIPLRSPREGHPIGANTGFVPIDVLSDCLDRTIAPFADAPPPEQGTWGAIAQYAGGIVGLASAIPDLVDTAMSQIPVPSIMELVPFPAATVMSPHLGTPHGHLHPPSWIPPAAPIPLPSFGFPVPAGCVSVLIGGFPALRCGDMGIGLTCVSLAPAFEVMTGSRNVFIGGARAARISDITMHCNPIALATIGSVLSDVANVGVGMANALAHQHAGEERSAAAEEAREQVDDASSEAEASAAAAEASGMAAQAAGEALAGTMAALQATCDAMNATLKALLGTDVGIAPGVGVVSMGSSTVLIGGASMPSASLVLGHLRESFARRSCTSRFRFVRWLGERVGRPNCA